MTNQKIISEALIDETVAHHINITITTDESTIDKDKFQVRMKSDSLEALSMVSCRTYNKTGRATIILLKFDNKDKYWLFVEDDNSNE